MPAKKYLIVIGGPTASGKTKAAIKVANHFGIEIISADSRQFYPEHSLHNLPHRLLIFRLRSEK